MSRQIISTNGQGRAQAEGRTYGIAAIVVALVVLLVFFALDRSGAGDRTIDQQVTGGTAITNGTATGTTNGTTTGGTAGGPGTTGTTTSGTGTSNNPASSSTGPSSLGK